MPLHAVTCRYIPWRVKGTSPRCTWRRITCTHAPPSVCPVLGLVAALLHRPGSAPCCSLLLPVATCCYLSLRDATQALFYALKQPGVSVNLLMALAGLVVGVAESPHDMCNHMLIGWVIDEDGLTHHGARREGMFYALNGVVQHLSQAHT